MVRLEDEYYNIWAPKQALKLMHNIINYKNINTHFLHCPIHSVYTAEAYRSGIIT